jgi:tetratricopeptide (TPR) repeat protein
MRRLASNRNAGFGPRFFVAALLLAGLGCRAQAPAPAKPAAPAAAPATTPAAPNPGPAAPAPAGNAPAKPVVPAPAPTVKPAGAPVVPAAKPAVPAAKPAPAPVVTKPANPAPADPATRPATAAPKAVSPAPASASAPVVTAESRNIRAKLASRLHQKAVERYEAGDYAGALEAVHSVLSIHTNDTANLFFRATIYAEQGKVASAIADFEAVIRAEPRWADAETAMGEIHYRTGEFSRALDHFRRARLLNPEDAQAQYMMYICLLLDGQQREADFIRAGTAVSRENPNYYFINAAYYFQTGQPEKAGYLYAAAQRMYPEDMVVPYRRPFFDQGWVSP